VAVLSDADRADVNAQFQREAVNILNLGITKAELRAAVNAADDWAEANASAFNTAIPQPARSAMSLKQKTLLLNYVIFKRAGLL
jgi:hypothetical protein